MIPESYADTPDKERKWMDLAGMYKLDRRGAIQRWLKIRTKDQKLELLKHNEAQIRLLEKIELQEKFGLPVRIIVLKPRKVGISSEIQAIFFHRTSSTKLQKAMTVAHDMDSTEEMFQMNDLFYNELPEMLRPMKRYSSRQEIVFENPDEQARRYRPGLRSQLTIGTAGKVDLGRSKDIHLLHCSESAFWGDAETTELSLFNAVPDLPSTMIFKESTPNGVGTKFHRDYEDAKAGRTAFAPYFMGWQEFAEYSTRLSIARDDFEDSLDDDEVRLIKAHNLTFEQLNWRRWAIHNKCGSDPNKFMQEYPDNDIDCFLVSGRPAFDIPILRRMIDQVQEPKARGMLRRDGSLVTMEQHQHGFVRIWKPPSPSKRYLLAGDVAEGLERGDFSVGHVYDWDAMEMVAEWHGHIEPDLFGEEMAKLGKVYNNCLIGVEANNHGGTVNTRLRNSGYPHLFYRQELENRSTRRVSKLGWLTTPSSRPLMIDSLADAMRDSSRIPLHTMIPSRETVQEMTTFVIGPTGKAEAQSGCFDDRVMASAIAMELRKRQGIARIFPSSKGGH